MKYKRPGTNFSLHLFVRERFGVLLRARAFTPGHSTPFAFPADAFFDPAADVAAWANRSGGKTLTASILAALEFLFGDNLQARVLAGSEDQATNLCEYWRNRCDKDARRADAVLFPLPKGPRRPGGRDAAKRPRIERGRDFRLHFAHHYRCSVAPFDAPLQRQENPCRAFVRN